MGVQVKQTIDFNPQARTAQLRDAVDEGLRNHRVKHLPLHFRPDARARYAPDYDPHGSNRQATKPLRQLLREMSPDQRKRWYAMTGNATVGKYKAAVAIVRENAVGKRALVKRYGGHVDVSFLSDRQKFKHAKIPLVHTGHMMRKVLYGTGRFVGPLGNRRLVIPVPFYFNFNPPGQIDKPRAMSAITEGEQTANSRAMEKEMNRQLRGNAKSGRTSRGFGASAA